MLGWLWMTVRSEGVPIYKSKFQERMLGHSNCGPGTDRREQQRWAGLGPVVARSQDGGWFCCSGNILLRTFRYQIINGTLQGSRSVLPIVDTLIAL